MLNVNWCFHSYMKVFCPSVATYSFVDNLTLAAREAFQVAQAFFALKTICLLFGLSTDDDKTYTWALKRPSCDHLSRLGFPRLSDASELGGAMTYGLARRTRTLRQRGLLLQSKWQKLKRSLAPRAQKLSVLPKVFWTKALHGSANCLIADSYSDELRREAVKALKISGGGSNPQLRLSLSTDMQADPGFYQLRLCLWTFRRMLRKSPDLLPTWKTWYANFDGHLRPGPFSRLLHCLTALGWSVVDPPYLLDHDGHRWDLYMVDDKTLVSLLEDAWLQFVASRTKHKTMAGLHGMDGYLTKLDQAHLSPHHQHLSSGAFMTNYEHSRYDEQKTPMCPHCQVEDDRAHWLICPRYQMIRDEIPAWRADNVELPACVVHHLLVPRQSYLVDWKQLLCQPADDDSRFLVFPPFSGYHHLFVDGSCLQHRHSVLDVAARGIVNATTSMVVAHSGLFGITQTIDRAELTAVVRALQWAQGTELGLL